MGAQESPRFVQRNSNTRCLLGRAYGCLLASLTPWRWALTQSHSRSFRPQGLAHRPSTGHSASTYQAARSEWLIYQFARSIGYLRGATSDTSLLDLVAGSHYSTPREADRPFEQVPLPPMPRSLEAVTVGRSLLQRPDDPADTADHARSVNISVRTLQLQFLQETGLPFGWRWRTAVRVAASAALMDAGHTIGQAGRQVSPLLLASPESIPHANWNDAAPVQAGAACHCPTRRQPCHWHSR